MLRNLTPVAKNLLILNVVVYIVCMIFLQKGIDLTEYLGAHYVASPLFQPYQVITHFFTHSTNNIFHIFMNMFILVMFGPVLERIWGPKRFFFAYMVAAIGAYLIYNLAGSYDIMQLKDTLIANGYDIQEINDYIRKGMVPNASDPDLYNYAVKAYTPMVGASGAIFGLMAAFAYLFPNTEMYLMFIPIPIKAKFLIGGYFLLEVYLSVQSMKGISGDSIAHLAHVGGAIFGFLFVWLWNKKDHQNFY